MHKTRVHSDLYVSLGHCGTWRACGAHDALAENTQSRWSSGLESVWLESFNIQRVTVLSSQIPILGHPRLNVLLFVSLWSDG